MSFGRLVNERVKEAAARHFDPAPIAIYRVHSADVAQSLIRHGKLPSSTFKPLRNRKTYQCRMTMVVAMLRTSGLEKKVTKASL
jgi:hypothetical protein